VTAVDPHPWAPWRATYGAWSDELSAGVPGAARISQPGAWTTHQQHLARSYSVLDTLGLRRSLNLASVEVLVDRASADGQRLADGTPLTARTIIDARGASASGRTQQTAYGVVVDRERAGPVLAGADALFMDWRTDHGAEPTAPPSFLYAVPVLTRCCWRRRR